MALFLQTEQVEIHMALNLKLASILMSLVSQDVQTDAPFHLIHLKVEVEKSKLTALLQECQAELTRENRHLASTGSERLIKEHRVSAVGRGENPAGFLPCLPLTHVNERVFSTAGFL